MNLSKRNIVFSKFFLAFYTLLIGARSYASFDNGQLGGDATVDDTSRLAYAQPSPNLTSEHLAMTKTGDADFSLQFFPPPAPEGHLPLGKKYNHVSCESCHFADGRGLPFFSTGEKGSLAVVRVSMPRGRSTYPSGPVPVPGIGLQIRDHAASGLQPDATVEILWQDAKAFTYSDGTQVSLRVPKLKITLPDGRPLPSNILTSMRVPQALIGVGLLDAVPSRTLLRFEAQRKYYGIKGHVNYVWDFENETLAVGKFGWKANTVNLIQQTATAFFNDMGVTNPLFPGPDDQITLTQDKVESAAFYPRTLAVPARRPLDTDQLVRGEQLFSRMACALCHRPTMMTGANPVPELADQVIHPYTDLLLHNMGPGLADGRPDYAASGSEWRTPPLWGIGLTKVVNIDATFLHDGRARTLEEAILWHDGEARASKNGFARLIKSDREALLAFLGAL